MSADSDGGVPDNGMPNERAAPRRRLLPALAGLAAVAAFSAFVALGTWQVQRRSWKLDLIARAEQRVTAAPIAAPGPAEWPKVSAARDEYRHVRLAGRFDHDRETVVQASTELGSGFWVLTPLRRDDGTVVLVNRGFVPPGLRERAKRREGEPSGATTITGLLRISEPGGAWPRHNDALADRWYSRDVDAIAKARALAAVAPYFVDADAAPIAARATRGVPAGSSQPIGGLTVTSFPNNHLVYAITWFALAAMVLAAAARVIRFEYVSRRSGPGSDGPAGVHRASPPQP